MEVVEENVKLILGLRDGMDVLDVLLLGRENGPEEKVWSKCSDGRRRTSMARTPTESRNRTNRTGRGPKVY